MKLLSEKLVKGIVPATSAASLLGGGSIPIVTTAAGGASIPIAAAGLPLLAAGAGGTALGTYLYNNSPQVRDASGGFMSGVSSAFHHALGRMSDEDRQKYIAQLEAEHFQQNKAKLIQNGQAVYSNGLIDNSLNPDLGKTASERAGNFLGNGVSMLGLGGLHMPSVVEREKEEMRRQYQQTMDDRDRRLAQQKSAQAAQ